MITAKDIVQSRAWSDMVMTYELHLHTQFTLADPMDTQELQYLRLRWDALRAVVSALEQQANEDPNGR